MNTTLMPIDTQKIIDLRDERKKEVTTSTNQPAKQHGKFTQKQVAESLKITIGKYKAIESGTSPIGEYVGLLCDLANTLDVDLIDLVEDKYEFRDKFFHIRLENLKTESEFNRYLSNLEKKLGRLTVFNTFPSSIYYSDNDFSQERYEFFSDIQKLGSLSNTEYYPINMVINFCFNICSRFSRQEKIDILNKMIHSFSTGKGHLGHDKKQIHIFDPKKMPYYHDSPTTTFIGRNKILIPSPTYEYALLVIKSYSFVDIINNFGQHSEKNMNSDDSTEFLEHLRDCLNKNETIYDLIEKMKENNSKAMRKVMDMVVNNLSPDFAEFKLLFNDDSLS